MPTVADAATPSTPSSSHHGSGVNWQDWSDSAFQEAKASNKLIILDLEAVWCHWCHVMDQQTYSNPEVQGLLKDHFVALKVDQDSRPDLANRYMEYAWPATVIYAPDGTELVKRAGYIPPDAMAKLLKTIVANPSPEPDDSNETTSGPVADHSALPEALKKTLAQDNLDRYDTAQGAWGIGGHKFMDPDTIEYNMQLANQGDDLARTRVVETLNQQLQLIDPAWGGVYQYSHGGDWSHPHFEKIMSVQAGNLKVYALAAQQFNTPRYLEAAQAIHRYVKTFLTSPDGGFYVSQDADVRPGEHSDSFFKLNDAQRRAEGIPRVDTHVYARENGWMIEALAALYAATGDKTYLDDAMKARATIEQTRSLDHGGFKHDSQDEHGPFLGDTLAMGQAYLALYKVTGDRQWLQRATDAGSFIEANFKDPVAGYPAGALAGQTVKPVPLRDENVRLVRFANLLHHYTGQPSFKAMAEHGMKFIALPTQARKPFAASTLLADLELNQDPVHMTVVGSKQDPKATALFAEALKYPAVYQRLEWFDSKEGPLPNADVDYPELDKPAAFVCSSNRCGTPIYDPIKLVPTVNRILKRPAPATVPMQTSRLSSSR